MIPTSNGQPLYSGHLKGNEELYVKDDSLVVIHEKKGNVFTIDLSSIRCVFPVSHDMVKIFWRAPKNVNKNGPWKQWNRYQYDFKLDLKKSFPDRKQRSAAEKTESKRLANVILHAVQQNHSINKPNMKGYIAMHTGEYLMNSYEGQCKFGNGEMLVTNLGIYFVVDKKGLCFDMPLDLLDSYNPKNKTVKIHYFEPVWQDGYDVSSRKNRNIEIRIKSESAQVVCDDITKAYSDGGAKEIRTFAKYVEEFGSLTSDEHYAQYYSGKYGTFKQYNDYLAILAKRKWGIPTTKEVGDDDAEVVFACLCTGIPLDVAGDLTEKDKKFREDTLRYHKQFEEYNNQYVPLRADIMDIITKNLGEDDSQKIRDECNPYIVFDTINELAENGSVSESFKPQSLIEWQKFKKDINEKIIKQKLNDFPNGFPFAWTDNIFCPWSANDAKRIVYEKDFSSILDAITSLNEKYNDIDKYLSGPMYCKTFEGDQRKEIKLRVRRVYDEWCKSHPLSGWTDHTDRSWVQYVIDNLNENNLEKRREHFGSEKTIIDVMRDAEMKSKNTKTRLERTMKPQGIPDKDIYIDAWYDQSKHRWFTTNPYFRIPESKLEIMSQDQCEQKYGYRATVFSEDVVEFKHGYPAIYNEEKKWWVLLCSISDNKITPEMVDDKFVDRTLRYETTESNFTIANDGGDAPSTEKEIFLKTLNSKVEGSLLPLNERIRRLLFMENASYAVGITDEDKMQQTPLITV